MSHLRHEAEHLKDWVRFEAEFKGEYAHQLTEAIKKCKTDIELKDIIVNSILDRYGMYYTKESKSGEVNRPTPETKKMLSLLNNHKFAFTTKSSRNSLLSQSIHHIKSNSGLYPLMYKAKQIFGNDADKELLEWFFEDYFNNFSPNDDHLYFVKKYSNLYQKEGKPWK